MQGHRTKKTFTGWAIVTLLLPCIVSMLHIQSTNLCLIHKPTLSWLCIDVSILSVGVALCGFPPSTQATPSTWPTTLMTWGFPLLPSSSPSVPWAFISTITQTGRGRRRGIRMEIAAFGEKARCYSCHIPYDRRRGEKQLVAGVRMVGGFSTLSLHPRASCCTLLDPTGSVSQPHPLLLFCISLPVAHSPSDPWWQEVRRKVWQILGSLLQQSAS